MFMCFYFGEKTLLLSTEKPSCMHHLHSANLLLLTNSAAAARLQGCRGNEQFTELN